MIEIQHQKIQFNSKEGSERRSEWVTFVNRRGKLEGTPLFALRISRRALPQAKSNAGGVKVIHTPVNSQNVTHVRRAVVEQQLQLV